MYYFIFTGPPAAGKNTIAKLLAKRVDKGVHIDVDRVRNMVIHPHKAPWEGKDGKEQHMLGIKNSCLLAKQFINEGYSIAITDVITDEKAKLYKELLKEYPFKIILLLPSFEEVKKRDITRKQVLTDEEFKILYEEQQNFSLYDLKIDNSTLFPEEVVKQLL